MNFPTGYVVKFIYKQLVFDEAKLQVVIENQLSFYF